ncbi:MAG: universal stress protein [Pseudomonadota bacterium]
MVRPLPVVVGIDFSTSSFWALAQAATLAAAWEVPLHCLHVVEEDDITDLAMALDQPMEALTARALASATRTLGEALAPFSEPRDIVASVVVGHPRHSLNRLVREVQAQLLVLGVHGQEQKPGVGSTALASVRDAPADVLVVRDSEARRYRAVLACTGLGPESDVVVMRAAELVSPGGTLDVVHALAPPWQRMQHGSMVGDVSPAARERFEQWARQGLSRVAGLVSGADHLHGIQVNEVIATGRNLSDTIVGAARERDNDLIVIGKHGRSAMANTLLGSVARNVLMSAHCSVLAVHTLATEGDDKLSLA